MHNIALPETFHLLFYVGLMFIISQSFGHLASTLKLPQMIGYLTAGIIFGPYLIGWYSQQLIGQDLEFFRDFALAIIAFSIGGSLQLPVLKRLRASLTYITLLQTFGASLCVFLAMWWLLPFSNNLHAPQNMTYIVVVAIILGAVSAATDPASVLGLVDEYEAKGDFKNILLGIVALDDVIAILFYTVAIAVCASLLEQSNGHLITTLGQTSLVLLTEIAFGLIIGFLVARSLRFFSEYRSMLGLLLGIIMAVCGLLLSIGLSPLLTCMMLGFMVTNVAKHELADEAMDIIHTIQQPVFGVFFFMAGAHLNIPLALPALGLAVGLTLARFAGKYGGTILGGRIAHADPLLTRNLGIALLPAAGVMIGLTLSAKDMFGGVLNDYAELMVTIVIGATLINEFLTPFFVRHAIFSTRNKH